MAFYLGLTLLLMPVQAVAVAFGLPLRETLPLWYHRRCCRIMGFQVRRRGRQSRAKPTLYVANHVSYFDIMILASQIKGSFVAKSEVAGWPFFGWLARLQRTVFVDRGGQGAKRQIDRISARLETGADLVLFPEGTSSDGIRVLPFKSAPFAAAELPIGGKPLVVQPVSLTYLSLDGMPMGRFLRPFFAWFGDMQLAAHLWHAAGLGRVTVVVEFHDTVTIKDVGGRKALRDLCYRRVAEGVASALTGRAQRLPAVEPASVTTL